MLSLTTFTPFARDGLATIAAFPACGQTKHCENRASQIKDQTRSPRARPGALEEDTEP